MTNPNEWIVEVNEDDEIVGKIERDIAHDMNGLKLHREVMTLLYTDESHKRFLLQHRALKKKQFPGYWTLSVTGHVDYSDITESDRAGYLVAAAREVEEEIGVRAKNLELMGKIIHKNEINHAMMGIVIGEYEGELKIDPEEVSEVKEFGKETLAEVSDKLTPGAKACLEYLGILK